MIDVEIVTARYVWSIFFDNRFNSDYDYVNGETADLWVKK